MGSIFWPEATARDIKFRMKNTLYRLRHAVGKDVILLDQEHYRFNNTIDYEYDVELFLKENALALKAKDPLHKLSHFREAAKLYKGPFLPEIGETWVYPVREVIAANLSSTYCWKPLKYIWTWLTMIWPLNFASVPSPSTAVLELAYRLSFRIYAAMGDRAAVVKQYSRCCEVLEREINTKPSLQTRDLYT